MAFNIKSKTSPIVIVGAGVFGLTTAIHLAQRGYKNVKILDKQPYHESLYSYDLGCDAASADINKIIRAAYGSEIDYQELALDAITHWKNWNDEIRMGKMLPPGFTKDDVVYINNGNLSMSSESSLPKFESDSLRNMTKLGFARKQIVLSSPGDVERAKADGFGFAVNPFNRRDNYGLLDTVGGFAYSDKACRFALHKAEELGVQTVFGRSRGMFVGFLRNLNGQVVGIETADGESHVAELTIMACGGWTPSLVPQLDNVCETTAGSVCIFQLRPGSPLWDRLAPQNFPTWTYRIRDGENGGLYGFARDPRGSVKIGYRGTKYTNPQTQADGAARSVPVTRWTDQSTRQLPSIAARKIRDFVQEFLPELISCQTKTRLCWYTDSFDNHFVIDFVPGVEGLMVATGGSGHGFKFLPNLGGAVVDRIEGKPNKMLRLWEWRSLRADEKPYNRIMEGVDGARSLHRQVLTVEDSLYTKRSHL